MPKYACPKCDSSMTVRSSRGRCFISCICGISHVLPDYEGEPNIIFLKFLDIMDRRAEPIDGDKRRKSARTVKHKKTKRKSKPDALIDVVTTSKPSQKQKIKNTSNASQELPPENTVAPKCRPKSDIDDMIRDKDPDKIIRDILFTKNYYICQYTVSDSSGPEPGDAPYQLPMNPKLAKYLESIGISHLYKFQLESYRVITGGDDVVIVAPTASGKTESFLIPIIQMSSEIKSPMFALIVYPTKALARDQFGKMQAMAALVGVRVAISDGDTPNTDKDKVLKSPPHILVTNFDTINYHLPRQTRFAGLLYNVHILVIDEVHTYNGIFGSNIHHLIKRLDRVCTHTLQLVAASATINEPVRFCSALFNRDVELVKTDQRRGRIDTVIMSSSTESKHDMILDVTRQFISQKHKTLVFSNSHRSAEIISERQKT